MARHTRLIPSLAALSVSLTGCSDDMESTENITGSWTVTVSDGYNWPIETSSELTATGGSYNGFAYGHSQTASGTLVVSASGEAELNVNSAITYVYVNPWAYGSESWGRNCISSRVGVSEALSGRQFGILFESISMHCEYFDGDEAEETEQSVQANLNLDCVLHPEEDVLDCIERIDGGFWAFERSTDK